jgi:hypothetical protein
LIEEIQTQGPNKKRRVNRGARLTESEAKVKKLKVCWSIECQNAQIQNQGLKWKRRPTSGSTLEFDRDAIELIFKIKITIEDLIEEITN